MLYVIRHGQVDTNVANQINGWNEEVLNETGINQSKTASSQFKNIKIDVVFCSPLLRTRQTYNNLGITGAKIIYDDRIKERNSNSMVYFDVKKLDKNLWYDKTKDIVYKDTEGFKNILKRVGSILEEIKNTYPDKNILIVTHGDICKAIYLYFNPDCKDISQFHQGNCEIISYDLTALVPKIIS